MRGLFIFFSIFLLLIQSPADAFVFHKKDYKQIFLNEAAGAEKRHNHNQAFHAYEKAIYYYGKDKYVVESYAQFCERNQYFEKAEKLYSKLYVLTKNKKYLFKKNLCEIKNGKLSDEQIRKLLNSTALNNKQIQDLYIASIYHFAYKENWKEVKNSCDKIAIHNISKVVITQCLVSVEKNGNKQELLKYYTRYSYLNPKDSAVVNKIINLQEYFHNYKAEEQSIKKLISQNPKDFGIRYKLAGFYEHHNQWHKAAQVYESLMVLGDRSEHVKRSYAYDMEKMHPKNYLAKNAKDRLIYSQKSGIKKAPIYKSEPLTGYKLYEKLFYQNWHDKNYIQAQFYLNKMLTLQPDNLKLLHHKVEIAMEQNNFQDALNYLEEIQKIKSLSKKDNILLAFLYSKSDNNQKSIEIIQNELNKTPKNKELLILAFQYSMADKDWKKAIEYNDKLLDLEPESEELLKSQGDLYSIEKNFPYAISYYEKLIRLYPKFNYAMELSNLYMANQSFLDAEKILRDLYNKYPKNKKVAEAYLNSLLAQQRTKDAYWVIKQNNLENTDKGLMVLGDLAMDYKHYDLAERYYYNALGITPDDIVLQNKLANSYRMLGYKGGAERIFKKVLEKEPENRDALLGLGSLQTDRKNFKAARKIFSNILKENPDYRPAKIAIADSYIASDEKLSALNELDGITPDEQTKMMKAQVFYDLNMPQESKDLMKNINTDASQKLKLQIKKDNAFTITPTYLLFNQQLADEFNLDYQKYGIKITQGTSHNIKAYMEYNVYWYESGSPYFLNNVANEFRGGIQGKPNKKFEYKTDVGVKAFQYGGGMILTDSWVKYYPNDKINFKLGFSRDNLQQTYLSAVGEFIDGLYTGRVADNRFYLEYNAKLPNQFYTFGRGCYGLATGQNLPTNQYGEGMIGVGRRIYDNPKSNVFQTVNLDIVTYNSAYQYNLLNLYSRSGQLYGGYFSPSYFNATTGNFRVEGKKPKLGLKYGFEAFAGTQLAIAPNANFTRLTWGVGPYLSYELNDHISFNAEYHYYNYADVQRHLFIANAVIRGFDKHDKK